MAGYYSPQKKDGNMKFKKTILILSIVFFLCLIACKDKGYKKDEKKTEENQIEKDNKEIVVDDILKQIKSMTLEEKLGQLIIVGFEGENINEETLDYVDNLKVGGFILFARNIVDENQTLKLLNDLKESNSNNDIPLFLSIDEEGGKVSRLSKSFVKIPPAMEIGNKNKKELAYELGNILGERIKSLGFNMDFAPVLDINSNSKNPVIGNRSFGTTVESVSENGIEAMKGLRGVGVIPSVKHFPGHGDTRVDSHINLPIVNKTMEELKSFELVPFMKAIDEDVEMVMVAHILYPEIDDNYPATMSNKLIQGLLRDELGYEGVIVSDDMTMGAIIENYTLEDAVLSFIESGGDIALVCHGRENPKKTIEKLEEAVTNGRLSEEDIDEKLYRILKLKEKFNLKDNIIEEIDLEKINNRTKKFVIEINN